MHELRAKDAELRRKDQQLFDREIELIRRQKEMESMRERIEKLEAAAQQQTSHNNIWMRFELFAQLTHDALLLERGICVNLIRETDTHTGCNAPALLRFNFVDEGLQSLSSSPAFK